jgi:electron transfer flavoprotein alpha/beta subunit
VTLAVCLHGAAVARSSLHLHPTDRRAIALAQSIGAEIVAVEAVAQRGSAPVATGEALVAGAHRAIRIVEPALADVDAGSVGLALAATLDRLNVVVVLFGSDADPEGLADIPACIALHMAAHYLGDVVDLTAAAETGTTAGDSVDVTIRGGAWTRRVQLPPRAVLGIAPGPTPSAVESPATQPGQEKIQVMSLADLKIDPGSLRREKHLRGIIQAAHRPLVTLHSAAAVGEFLRIT